MENQILAQRASEQGTTFCRCSWLCTDCSSLLLSGRERRSELLTRGSGQEGWDLTAVKSHFLAIPKVNLVGNCSGLSRPAPAWSAAVP